MSVTLNEATVKKVIYYNNQSNWGVFAVKYPTGALIGDGTEDLIALTEIIVAGNFEGVYDNCKITLTGVITEHPKYGKQIQLQAYRVLEDNSSKEAVINFLTKSSINGIHKALAKKIYAQFAENSIKVVLHDTEALKQVKGIGEKTYEVIKKSVSTYFEMEELLQYCAEIGLNKFALTMQLYKEFGKEAVNLLKENPYQLLVMSESLSFAQVDEIAMKAGVKPDDDNRLIYGLLHVLNRESVLQGSTGCNDSQLKQMFLKTLGLQNNQLYRYALTKLAENGSIYRDDNNVFLKTFYDAEKDIATRLLEFKNITFSKKFDEKIVDEEIHNFDFQLNDGQINAINSCIQHQFSVITAQAGCGKSTISKAIIRILARHHGNIILLAPTAKAAKRLAECSGFKAYTIHRYLKIKDSTLRSSEEVIVPRNTTILIDEASMLDVRLFNKVLEATLSDTRIILVGDTRQLPSVQAGNLLEDIVNSKKFNVCYLTDITRQADDSNIIKYSNMVNEGHFIPLDLKTKDLIHIAVGSNQRDKAIDALKKSYMKAVEEYGLLNTQVICAYKGGSLGVNNLNKVFKAVYQHKINANTNEEEEIFPFKIGDKVRHTVNDYDLKVFNGETGTVMDIIEATSIDNLEGKDLLVVDYGDRYVTYDKFTANELTLAYASTVHASQGSEYDCVYVILDNEISNLLLVRKIVYTAITRAKKKCYILSIDGCVNTAISNDHYKERLTKLKDFVTEESGDLLKDEYCFN